MTRHGWPDVLPEIFRGSEVVKHGVLTAGQLRNRSKVVPVLHDVYRPAHVPLTHPLKCRAAGLLVPDGVHLTGASMASALGVPLAAAKDPVTMVVIGTSAPAVRGITIRRASHGPLGRSSWEGVPVAPMERMAFDCAAGQPLETAVARLDAVVRAGLVDVGRLAGWLANRHDDHVVSVRAATTMCDGRAESWPESVVRVRLRAVGLDVVPQVVVRTERGFAGRVDLAIERLRLAVEYDGRWHGDTSQFAADRERLNRLAAAGWTVVHVTAETLRTSGALEAMVLGEVARLSSGSRNR